MWPNNKEDLAKTNIDQTYKDISLETIEVLIGSMPFQIMLASSAIVGSTG